MYPVASIGGGCCYFPPCADTVVAGKVLQPRNGQSTIDLFLSITLYVTYDYPRWRRTDFYNGGNDAVYLFPSPLFCLVQEQLSCCHRSITCSSRRSPFCVCLSKKSGRHSAAKLSVNSQEKFYFARQKSRGFSKHFNF